MPLVVSIPQAVSTVATTLRVPPLTLTEVRRFNTASGKHCCNLKSPGTMRSERAVSIPQAVSTVATAQIASDGGKGIIKSFNTASGKHCCNKKKLPKLMAIL